VIFEVFENFQQNFLPRNPKTMPLPILLEPIFRRKRGQFKAIDGSPES